MFITNNGFKFHYLKTKRFSLKNIPIIDLKGLRGVNRNEMIDIGKQIDEANKEIGFFFIKNSGIDVDFMKKTLKSCEDFFLSEMDNKMKCRINEPPEFKPWGYFPRNYEQLKRGKEFDVKQKSKYMNDINEQFNMQNMNPNANFPKVNFPPYPPEFQEIFSDYWKQSEQLAALLMKGFSLGLGLQDNFFEDKFNSCSSVLRVLYYPDNVKIQPGQFRASEHTDYGSLTILYSTAPGLQVKTRQGEWLNVEIPFGQFVVNIGDLMAFWTNDRWVSTPHRVISDSNENPVKRFSLAFFHNPNSDACVETISTCINEDNPKKYDKVISGQFIMKKFRASIGEDV